MNVFIWTSGDKSIKRNERTTIVTYCVPLEIMQSNVIYVGDGIVQSV
jgi:hypothetical protein